VSETFILLVRSKKIVAAFSFSFASQKKFFTQQEKNENFL